MTNQDDSNAQLLLVDMLNDYTKLLNKQMEESSNGLSGAVEVVMNGIMELTTDLEEGAKRAQESLDNTFLNPDEATQGLLNSIQSSVGDVIENTLSGEEVANDAPSPTVDEEKTIKALIDRITPEIEDFHRTREGVFERLFEMMGALSNDDVVAKRLEHVGRSLKALEQGLSYLLGDFGNRCTPEKVKSFRTDLFDFNKMQYSSTEEVKVLEELFKRTA